MNITEKVLFAASLLAERVKYNIWPAKQIHLIGDSLIASQPWYKYPRKGWGNELYAYLNTDKVKVINHARNGGSTMSFEKHGYFKQALKTIRKGDIVLFGFTHNDRAYTPPNGETSLMLFKSLITKFITQVKEKQALPILCTPITLFKFEHDHGEFPQEIGTLSHNLDTGLIDLYTYSKNLQLNADYHKAKELYLITEPGRFIMHPNGINDYIHLTPYGAQIFAKFVSESVNLLL